jgi:parvulin-like peptidyl-prolyl isomerase
LARGGEPKRAGAALLFAGHFLPDRNQELAIIKQTTDDKQVEIQPVMDAERIGQIGELVSPGQMVPEFDQVVFRAEVNQVQGPVKTQCGYQLIEITSRTERETQAEVVQPDCRRSA